MSSCMQDNTNAFSTNKDKHDLKVSGVAIPMQLPLTNQDPYPKNQRERILKQLLTFSSRGFEATNCIFKKGTIEICYILEEATEIDKEKLKQELAHHLKIDPLLLKLKKLRSKPVFKQTHARPGGTAVMTNGTQCCIGAFVAIQDKGVHALMPGHGNSQGEKVFHQNGQTIGEIVVSLNESPTQVRPTNFDLIFRDISIARLDTQLAHSTTVLNGKGARLQLMKTPVEAEDDMMVRLYTYGERLGRIDSSAYHRLDTRLNITHHLISVCNDQGHAVHDEGESGILIVTNPVEPVPYNGAENIRVLGIGMLVAREEITVDDDEEEEETTTVISLAAPLTTSFELLRQTSYCEGAEVRFC